MFYEKQIRYIDYREKGEKIRTVGFMKAEVREREARLWINITGLGREVGTVGEITLHGTDGKTHYILGKIRIDNGKGSFSEVFPDPEKTDVPFVYQDMALMRISLGKDRELLCVWQPMREKEESEKSVTVSVGNGGVKDAPVREKEAVRADGEQGLQKTEAVKEENKEGGNKEEENKEEKRPLQIRNGEKQNEEIPEKEKADREIPGKEVQYKEAQCEEEQCEEEQCKETQRKETQYKETEDTEVQCTEKKQGTEMVALRQNRQSVKEKKREPYANTLIREKKWQQLAEIYPHISPFHDERDYLSIGPGDFVILPEKYYRLISNSFLLHGFYNYGHMVLARMTPRGEEKYYLGVPGNFYEKERQAALMFGFESFECRREPAGEGDFGYYMIRIEL